MPNESRILIVEDDNVSKTIYRELLRTYDFYVDIVESAELAIEQFNQNHYDLLLVDIRLPRMNGFELTKKIRATEKGRSVPIVGITAITIFFIDEEFKLSGMNNILEKPVFLKEIDELLRCYCIKSRASQN